MLTVDLFVSVKGGHIFQWFIHAIPEKLTALGHLLGCWRDLTNVDSFPSYGFAGLFQLTNASHTIVVHEINLYKSDCGSASVTEARADKQFQWPFCAPCRPEAFYMADHWNSLLKIKSKDL